MRADEEAAKQTASVLKLGPTGTWNTRRGVREQSRLGEAIWPETRLSRCLSSGGFANAPNEQTTGRPA